ncbi:MAG: DUF4923 family protein [Rikenellaceae bacterium]
MKKVINLCAACLALMLSSQAIKAQTLTNIISTVSSAVTAVTGGETLSASGIAGTWTYNEPAMELESDGILSSVAGSAVATQLESQLSTQFEKVGITSGTFSFTFASDLSFSCTVKGKSLSGTYTIDSANSKIALKFSAAGTVNIGTMNAYATLSGSSLSLLFSADALLTFIEKVSSLTSSSASLSTIASLAENYDGLLLGFGLTSGTTTTTTSTSTSTSTEESTTSKVSSAIKGLF